MATTSRVWTERHAEMVHGKTRYWEAGAGYPTILIHGAGWTSGCESWVRNIGPLSEKLHVYAIDCLNWGVGDVFQQEFSFAYLVDHVREFMDLLGIERANFVGHSMGGWIVTLLSYESPERVNKVVNVARRRDRDAASAEYGRIQRSRPRSRSESSSRTGSPRAPWTSMR